MPMITLYIARSASGTRSEMTMLEMAIKLPPPAPCIAVHISEASVSHYGRASNEKNALRAAMSQFMFCAVPASTLPRKKNPTQAIMIGRRPTMSASWPVKGRMAAAARLYAAPTQTNSSPPLRSLVIVGSAVETAVMSRAERKLQTTTAVKESQKTEPRLGFAAFSGGKREVGEEDMADGAARHGEAAAAGLHVAWG